MNGRGLVVALLGTVLAATPAAVLAPAPAVAAPVVPCPTEKLSPPPQRPPKPTPPELDPEHAKIGGEALATTGLAIPEGAPTPPKLTASTWLVADLDTGQVLGGCNPHGYETPASVQKVLLAATMIPRLDPKQVVQVTREDLKIERGSSAVGLVEGGRYPIEILWYGLLFDSGNDAANVLARVGGGTKGQAGGVEMMNAEARRLGALQTHAVTPSGLDGPGQFTSAYDLVLIARAAFALPDFRKYVSAKTAQIPPQPPKDPRGFQIQNDNGLLKSYPGALGGKSGFTTLARHSFVGAAKRGDRTLVAAVLGAEARPIRASEQTARLLDWGFALPPDASVGRLVEPGEVDPSPSPTPERKPAAANGAARSSDGGSGTSSTMVIGLTVAVVAVALVLMLAATRRRAVVRARRAALAERRSAAAPRPTRPGGHPPPTVGRTPGPRRPPEETWEAGPGGRQPAARRSPEGGRAPGPHRPSEEAWEAGRAPGARRPLDDGREARRRPEDRRAPGPRRPPEEGGRAPGPRRPAEGRPRAPEEGWEVRPGGRAPSPPRPPDDPAARGGGTRTSSGMPDDAPFRGGGREVPGQHRAPGRGEVSGGIYRPVDPQPFEPPSARRGPRPPAGPRPVSGYGAPDDYYPPPLTDRSARPDGRVWGERGASPEGYPPPGRRPPAPRRPNIPDPYGSRGEDGWR